MTVNPGLAGRGERSLGNGAIGRAAAWLGARPWLLLPVLALPALWPFCAEGLPRSFDGGLHLLRLGALDGHLRQGVLFPRWVPEMLLGYGYPVFNYYAASTYYAAELFHLLGLGFYDALIATQMAAVIAAGLGMYWLAHDVLGREQRWAALVAAVAYMVSPYLLTNIYIRGATAEAAAMALLPVILGSTRRLLRDPRPEQWVLPTALSTGALALTHNITLLLFTPVLVATIALLWLQGGRARRRLGLVAGSLLLAMGASAFFWLPLLAERTLLAGTAYEIAREAWLPSSVWTWENFLQRSLAYRHSFARPIQLGLVQAVLGVAGFFLARRRDAEWLFFGGVAVAAALAMGAWALPLWTGRDILAVVQFAWRLLSILTLPLSLFVGGIVLAVQPGGWRVAAASGLIALIVVAQMPRLQWMDVFAAEGTEVGAAVLAHVELDKGAVEGGAGNSSVQEFRPRWAPSDLTLEPGAASQEDVEVVLQQANAYDLEMAVRAGQPTSLRLNNFYFPGWRVRVDGEPGPAPYPTTNLGLFTVDVPAGTHVMQIEWTGTVLERLANGISLVSLLVLAGVAWRLSRPRWLALVPLALWGVGLLGLAWQAPLVPVQQPGAEVLEAGGARLLGYRVRQPSLEALELHPYWQVDAPPASGWRAQWELQDMAGNTVVEMTSRPYYNALEASNWPPATIVGDAYRLPLPPGLAAGSYRLLGNAGSSAAELARVPVLLGTVELAGPAPAEKEPEHRLDVVFTGGIGLVGFDLRLSGGKMWPSGGAMPVVAPGDELAYTLYWRAEEPAAESYHGLVQLLDHAWQVLATESHVPGPVFRPSTLWSRYRLQPDTYRLRIPEGAPGGVYRPLVGLYEFETLERLPRLDEEGQATPDDTFLPTVKVVARPERPPQERTEARFGDLATLTGYDLEVPAGDLRPGTPFTVTLHFRGEAGAATDYTRFVHVAGPDAGMAAQQDSQPQGGANPTSSWQPGETIVDVAPLVVAQGAAPGTYTIYVGLYDQQGDGQRLPVRDARGEVLPDGRFPLTTVVVGP